MNALMILILLLSILNLEGAEEDRMRWKKLNPMEKSVIEDKGTEAPFTGKYYDHDADGIYRCKRCGAALYRSDDKFDSGCGWPSFDDEIKDAVTRQRDADGRRIEITCTNCGAHLGHVFEGEGFTEKDTRHCVNSISLEFEAEKELSYAYIAGGCFWGVEFYLEKLPGVIKAESGYMGGKTKNPQYNDVCSGLTEHAETVRVTFDPKETSYENILKLFFEIHDPTQLNHQGPDYGSQYRSAIFYSNDSEKNTAVKLINILKNKGYNVVTVLKQADKFWKAENYHQNYYQKKGGSPYCHKPVKRFD